MWGRGFGDEHYAYSVSVATQRLCDSMKSRRARVTVSVSMRARAGSIVTPYSLGACRLCVSAVGAFRLATYTCTLMNSQSQESQTLPCLIWQLSRGRRKGLWMVDWTTGRQEELAERRRIDRLTPLPTVATFLQTCHSRPTRCPRSHGQTGLIWLAEQRSCVSMSLCRRVIEPDQLPFTEPSCLHNFGPARRVV